MLYVFTKSWVRRGGKVPEKKVCSSILLKLFNLFITIALFSITNLWLISCISKSLLEKKKEKKKMIIKEA